MVDISEAKERILAVIDKTGYMTVDQAREINYGSAMTMPAIKQLKREGKASWSPGGDMVLKQPWRRPWPPMLDAIDVLIPFAENVKLSTLYTRPYVDKPVAVPGREGESREEQLKRISDFKAAKAKEEKARKKRDEDPLILGFFRGARMYEIFRADSADEMRGLSGKLAKRYAEFLKNAEETAEGVKDMAGQGEDPGEFRAPGVRYVIVTHNEDLLGYDPAKEGREFPYAYAIVRRNLTEPTEEEIEYGIHREPYKKSEVKFFNPDTYDEEAEE